MAFTEEDRQQLIEFFKEHPMLWNHHVKEYRNRDLRRINLECLAEQLGARYSVEKIQQEWHNLTTYLEREHIRMEGSKKSGSGSDEVYQTKWPYYGCMEFCMDKSIPDDAVSTLSHVAPVPKKAAKTGKINLEEKKAKLWEVLAERLGGENSACDNGTWQQAWQQGFQAGFQQAWQQCSQMFMPQQMQSFAAPEKTSPNIQSMPPAFHSTYFRNTHPSYQFSSTIPNMSRANSAYPVRPNSPVSPLMSVQPEPSYSPTAHAQPSPPQRIQPLTPRSRPGRFNTANINMCVDCGRITKYMCVDCSNYACNVCSTPADPLASENYCEEGEVRRVGYCGDCSK